MNPFNVEVMKNGVDYPVPWSLASSFNISLFKDFKIALNVNFTTDGSEV